MFWRRKRRDIPRPAPTKVGDEARWRICLQGLTMKGPWQTMIAEDGKVIWVGSFDELCDAVRPATQVAEAA